MTTGYVTDLLQRIIRIDTTNPPGNERPLQELLARELEQAGFVVEQAGVRAERPNLVATLAGTEPGPVLGLLSHVDTVPADASAWSCDPWSGELSGGEIWGRGTQDMKGQTAAEVAAAVALARGGWRPARGALKVIVVVDEECGSTEGAAWLCAERPDLARCDFLINEGAGPVVPFAGRRLVTVCIAEKGVARFSVSVDGRPGHASMPNVADNPLPRLAQAIIALGEAPAIELPTAASDAMFAALGVAGIGELRDRDPRLATFAEPMLTATLAPTMVSGSQSLNVIPARAELRVDCRVPPGYGEQAARDRVAAALAGLSFTTEVQFGEVIAGNGSPPGSPLMDAIDRWLAAEEPQAATLPFMLPAYTDSRSWRDSFPDCVAYGFFPQRERSLYEVWPLLHGIDERITVADLQWAQSAYEAIARDLLG